MVGTGLILGTLKQESRLFFIFPSKNFLFQKTLPTFVIQTKGFIMEHKFKPIIMEEEFNWDLPADPDPKSDNYYNGIVSKELGDSSNIGETLLGVIHSESVRNQSDFVNEGIETILDRLGLKSAKPLTRKEKLLAFVGFQAGSIWERLVEDPSQTEPASPIEVGILKTNGKVC